MSKSACSAGDLTSLDSIRSLEHRLRSSVLQLFILNGTECSLIVPNGLSAAIAKVEVCPFIDGSDVEGKGVSFSLDKCDDSDEARDEEWRERDRRGEDVETVLIFGSRTPRSSAFLYWAACSLSFVYAHSSRLSVNGPGMS